jgi:hypothetical protein
LSRVAKKRREDKRKKKATIKKGIIFTITSGALLAGITSATALPNEQNKTMGISKVQDISFNSETIDTNKISELKVANSVVEDSTYSEKTLDKVVYKVEISDNLNENKSIESNNNQVVIEEDNILEKLRISGYINFNGEGDFVSPVDVFNGSKISISNRINPEKIVTKENEESIFNPLQITGTEVMIVDNNLYKLDIDDYSTIYYEKIEDKATIDLFRKQIDRANSSVSQVEEYNNLQRVQSNLSELEITGIDLEKYDIEALGIELNFAPILLSETYNENLGRVTAKYPGQMYYGDEVFIVTDVNNEVEGIYKIDNFNDSKLKKIKSSASISNILKQYKEKNIY